MRRPTALLTVAGMAALGLVAIGEPTQAGVPSPTGRIAFTSDREALKGPSSQIYVVNADGSGFAKLTNFSWWAMQPTWSPDGARIAFVGVHPEAGYKGDLGFPGHSSSSFHGNGNGALAHQHDIYVMNADGR